MKFWAIDSPVMRVLGRLGDIIILNMIFVVGCIPVITIGTSLSALYAVAMKMARGEDPSVWKEFWKAYKRNFRPATICWLVMAVIAILLFVDFRIIGVLKRGSESMYSIMRIVLAVILGMWMLMFQYLFPYIARFENGIFATLRNASRGSAYSVYDCDCRIECRFCDFDIVYIQNICNCKYRMGVLWGCGTDVCTGIPFVPDF